MREVIGLLVGSSYKSGSILKRLECPHPEGIPRTDFVIEEIKGKSRVLNLKANVEIPTRTDQVEKICREVCLKVGACPNLISTQRYLSDEGCPLNCQNLKSKSANVLLNNEQDETGGAENMISANQNILSHERFRGGHTHGMKERRGSNKGKRKRRTNPDHLLIAEHNQLRRQRSRDKDSSERSGEASGESGCQSSAEEYEDSLTSAAVSRNASRSNSPNCTIGGSSNQLFPKSQSYPFSVTHSNLKHRKSGKKKRKEWERYSRYIDIKDELIFVHLFYAKC